MKTILIVWICILTPVVVYGEHFMPLAQGWSEPVTITHSKDSLVGRVILYRWHNTIIALQGQDDNSAKCFLMNSNNAWSEAPLTGVPRGYSWDLPALDEASDKVFFEHNYVEYDQLIMDVLVGRMTLGESFAVQDSSEKKWVTSAKGLFGDTYTNDIRLTERLGTRRQLTLGIGFNINGQELYIPCCLGGFTNDGKGVALARGPYKDGVLRSIDSGINWHLETISDLQAWSPSVCKTKDYYYFFSASLAPERGEADQLWFARKSVAAELWDAPNTVIKTFGNYYIAMSQDDIVHLCWLDNQNEKRMGNQTYSHQGNYEVAYFQRKDSDSSWSKHIILSKGLLYAFSPSMSVEGNKIVIVWAGVQTAGVWHSPSDPNDIYYVTSKDGGKSWTEPLRVTDNVKSGITAGNPQVILLNGVIRLTYIQGKLNLKQESPGLTKLNQPPWPIYYTQRPFPD